MALRLIRFNLPATPSTHFKKRLFLFFPSRFLMPSYVFVGRTVGPVSSSKGHVTLHVCTTYRYGYQVL